MHIVVVGGGILGASAAFHLARAGAEVTIVDQVHEGRATAAGAGIICPWVSGTDDAAFYRLYVEGARYYRELVPVLAERGETDLGFRRVGALVVSDDADELAAFHAMLDRRVSTRRRWAPRVCFHRAMRGRCFRRCAPISQVCMSRMARV